MSNPKLSRFTDSPIPHPCTRRRQVPWRTSPTVLVPAGPASVAAQTAPGSRETRAWRTCARFPPVHTPLHTPLLPPRSPPKLPTYIYYCRNSAPSAPGTLSVASRGCGTAAHQFALGAQRVPAVRRGAGGIGVGRVDGLSGIAGQVRGAGAGLLVEILEIQLEQGFGFSGWGADQGNRILSQVLNSTFSLYLSLAAHLSRLVSIPRRQLVSRFSSPRANRRITLRFAGA